MKGKQQYLFRPQNNPENTGERWKITIPLDTLTLTGLAIVLLLILSFSLGVEKGRKTAYYHLAEKKDQELAQKLPETEAIEKEGSEDVKELEKNTLGKDIIDSSDTKTVDEAGIEKGKYYIQVASFIKDEAAKREAKNLESAGYSALVLKKGKYMAVYVGGFESSQEARKRLKILNKKYKDCIVRRL